MGAGKKLTELFNRVQDSVLELSACEAFVQGTIADAILLSASLLEDCDPMTSMEVKSHYRLKDGRAVAAAFAFSHAEAYEDFVHSLMECEDEDVIEEAGIHYWWNEKLNGWIRLVLLP